MGLVSFAGGLIGGGSAKKGLSKAAAAQAAESRGQQERLNVALNNTLSGYQPYSELGANAAQGYADLMGIGGTSGTFSWGDYLANNPDVAAEYQSKVDKTLFPTAEAYAKWHYDNYGQAEGRDTSAYSTGAVSAEDAQARAIASLKESPLFRTLFDTGEEAILANASATGGLRGGNTARSLADFGADTLSAVIQNQLQGYQGAIGTGLNATGAVTNARYGTATGQNNAGQAATDALVQKILGKAGINSQNWQNAGGFLDEVAGLF